MSAWDDIRSDPYPVGFVERKPGKPKLYPGYEPGAPTQALGWGDDAARVGWGDEGDADAVGPDYPDESARSPYNAVADTMLYGTPRQGAERQFGGWGNLLPQLGQELGAKAQRIQQAPQVQQLGQHINQLWNHPADQPLPQRLLQDAQQVGWEIPTTAYRAGLDAAKIGAGGKPYGQNAGDNPLVQYAPDSAGMGAAAVDVGRLAAKTPGAIRAAGKAIADPRSIPGMVARGPLAFAMGAAGGAPKSGKALSGQVLEKASALPGDLTDAEREMAKWLKSGSGGNLTDEEVGRRIQAVRAREANAGAAAAAPQAPALSGQAVNPEEQARVAFNAERASRARNPGPSGAPARSVRQQAARVQEQAAAGVTPPSAPRSSQPNLLPAARIQQILGRTKGDPTTLATHFAKALPDMTPEQVAAQVAEIRKADPQFFEKAGVPGVVTEAAASVKVGDEVQAKVSVAKAAQKVAEQRATEKAAAKAEALSGQALRGRSGQATGAPPEPPKPPKPPEVDTSNPFDEPDRVVVEHLPSLPADLQHAAVSSLARGMQVGSHALGGAAGFAFGYNQDQNDDEKTKIIRGLLYGGAGFEAAHVVSGGKLKGLPNRAMEMYRRQLLSPSTVIVPKIGQDVTSLIIAPVVRGISATLERGPVAGVNEAVAHLGGYWHGLTSNFARDMLDAIDVRKPLTSGTYGEAGTADHVLASPGEAYGTLWTRLIQGMTQGVEHMHESGVQWANAVPMAKKEAALWKTETAEDAIAWLNQELHGDKEGKLLVAMRDEMPDIADKIESGLWSDPDVAAFAQEAHVNQQVADFASTLPEPTQVAKDWTLTQTIGKGLRRGSPGQGGRAARAASGIAGGLQDLLDVKVAGAQVPLGKMLMPFKTVVANAVDQFVNFIPLVGHLNTAGYPEIRQSTRIAKQVVGGATVAALLGIVGDGATDSGPTDEKERKKWLGQGNIANSFRGPDGRWYPIRHLPAPLQVLLRTAGALNGYKRDGLSSKGLGDQGLAAFRDLGAAISDLSVFQSILDLGSFLSTSSNAKAGALREAGFMLGGLAGSNLAVPATAERANMADTSGDVLANLKSRLPGIEKQVPDRLNPSGTAPRPNPAQGWRSLLGASAGREPLNDKVAQVYYDEKYGPGLNINRKELLAGATAIPLPQDVQRAVFERAGQLLQDTTPGLQQGERWKGADDAKKRTDLGNLQRLAWERAFWETVNTYGKDKLLASLPPDKQSQFKGDSLEHDIKAAEAKAPFQTRAGQPFTPSGMTTADAKALMAKYAGLSEAQIKAKVRFGDQRKLEELKKAQAYSRANAIDAARKSPDWADYVRHKKLSGISDGTWKRVEAGQEPLIGKPGQYPLANQEVWLGEKLVYDALPAGDARKTAWKPHIDTINKQYNVGAILQRESPANAAKEAA